MSSEPVLLWPRPSGSGTRSRCWDMVPPCPFGAASLPQVLRSRLWGAPRRGARLGRARSLGGFCSLSSAGAQCGPLPGLRTPQPLSPPREPHPSLHTPREGVSRREAGRQPLPHGHTYSRAETGNPGVSSPTLPAAAPGSPGARGPALHGPQTSAGSQGAAHCAQGHSKGAPQGGVPEHHWAREPKVTRLRGAPAQT